MAALEITGSPVRDRSNKLDTVRTPVEGGMAFVFGESDVIPFFLLREDLGFYLQEDLISKFLLED